MSLWKSWQSSVLHSISSVARAPIAIPPALIVALVLMLSIGAGIPAVSADAGVQVTSQRFGHTFSRSLEFTAQISSARPVSHVVLFYGIEGESIVRRIYPRFTPGADLSLSHVEPLEPGQFAPGTRLRAWWHLETVDGVQATGDVMWLNYTHDEHDWQRLSDERVDLYWYGSNKDRDQAQRILDKAAQVVGRLEQQMGVEMQERVDIWVYNTQRDMVPALSQRSDVYDERILTLGVAMDENTLVLLGSHRNVEQTVAHELSHLVVGIATDNPFVALPRWLDEGLAMRAEGELPADNRAALERAVRDDELLSVRSMTSYAGRAELVDLYYGQAHSIVGYLLDAHGAEAMSRLLGAFASAQPQEEALQTAYGFGLDDLDARWRDSLGLAPRRAVEPESASDNAALGPSGVGSAGAPQVAGAETDAQGERRGICPGLGLVGLIPLLALLCAPKTLLPRA